MANNSRTWNVSRINENRICSREKGVKDSAEKYYLELEEIVMWINIMADYK